MLIIDIAIIIIIVVMLSYTTRHYRFFWNRMFEKQKRCHDELAGSYKPSVSILIPAHNEEKVLHSVLDRLVESDYPKKNGNYELIVINDQSTDQTGQIADSYAEKYPFVKVVHRTPNSGSGKPEALNVAFPFASNEIILCFDSDYQPPKDCVQRLVAPFSDVEVGVVMGRVVPMNTPESYLTRLMDLERSGGYQVDQQARYNLDLLPQFGGTVGGFRRSALKAVGGWDSTMLAEDTDLTYKVFLRGWKVGYVNLAECYEEAVSSWDQKHKQLRRWAIGHNQCLFKYFSETLTSPVLNWKQKLDGILLLGVYVAPVLMIIGWILGIISYLFAPPWWSPFFPALLFTLSYNNVGNFAVFNEVGGSVYLDKRGRSIWLLPLAFFNFFGYVLICTTAFFDSVFLQAGKWRKTKRTGNGTHHYNNLVNNGNHKNGNNKDHWDKTKRNGNGIRYYNNHPNHKNGGGNGK